MEWLYWVSFKPVKTCQSLQAQMKKKHEASSNGGLLIYLWIKCIPEGVSTISLTSPGLSPKATSSNACCISPCPKNPLFNQSATLFSITLAGNWQVALLSSTAAVWLGLWKITEGNFICTNAFFMTLNDSDRFLLWPCYLCFSPATRSSAILMFN